MTSRNQIARRQLLTVGAIGTGVAAATLIGSTPAGAAQSPVPVFTDEPGGIYVPYRAFDSRVWPAAQGGGIFRSGQVRTIAVNASVQGPSADHVFLTVTVTATTGTGYLTVYPADRTDVPGTSTINWQGKGQTVAAGLLTRCEIVAGTGLFHQSRINVRFAGSGEVHVVLDVTATFGSRLV